jgi:NAD(P)-dependent dehydrogenase (short-subunit alcohol dehydrogenase family)
VASPAAIITGASGGLGSVVTPMFLDAGYRVTAIALDWPGKPRPSSSLHLVTADLTSSARARAATNQAVKRHGQIDALIHLVGSFEGGCPLDQTSDDVWDRMLAVNLRTAVNMMRAVIPTLRQQRRGSIVVVGSTAATDPVVTWSAFGAAVSALCHVVQVTAAELADVGVTVNAVLPTTIDTPIVREWCGDADALKWVSPRALGEMMLWLCSPAGRDLTGALLPFQARQPHPCRHWHGETD